MPVVRVEPSGIELEVQPSESLAEAAWRLRYIWPTRCWGQAECMACYVRILDGEGAAAPPGDTEVEALQTRLPRRLRSHATRLACQLRVTGEGLVVEKTGVRPQE